MIACMGGNCTARDTCADYQRGYGAGFQPERTITLVERLCSETEEPIPIVRVVKQEEREDVQ